MSNEEVKSGIVQVRRHNGDRYDGSAVKPRHSKKGSAVTKGTVVVRPASPEKRLPLGGRGVRAKKEVSYLEWKEYAVPRYGILRQKEVSEMLDVVRRRKNTFQRHMVERLVEAVRKHFTRHNVAQCPVTVVAKGRYPLNPEVGTFYRLQVEGSDGLFPIPKEFLPKDKKHT